MALSKTVVVDKIEVLQMGQLQVRVATVISDDGVELSRTFHRHVLAPGDDLSGQDDRVAAVASATWTPAVVDEWEATVAAREASLP
jgi:urease accessory protein UreE